MPKTYEYHEGTQAKERFEVGMKALFQVPKSAVPEKKKACKNRAKKPKSSESDVSRDPGEASPTS
jgi:hypothetical protein